jgi:5'-deoxy-5'-methylthioadenosine phosphorylase
MSEKPFLAIIGGTGSSGLEDFAEKRCVEVSTPWGSPSAPLRFGRMFGADLVFLERHGDRHMLAPHQINYRANLWALDSVGARQVVALAAVGGITREMEPGSVVIPDQLIDYTYGRAQTFSDEAKDPVRHIDFTDPYDAAMRQWLVAGAGRAGVPRIERATYGVTQGPRLETRQEIRRMEQDGCDLVGMTSMPEAALARELGLSYACCALVSNWAAGRGTRPIHDELEESLRQALVRARLILEAALALPLPERP